MNFHWNYFNGEYPCTTLSEVGWRVGCENGRKISKIEALGYHGKQKSGFDPGMI